MPVGPFKVPTLTLIFSAGSALVAGSIDDTSAVEFPQAANIATVITTAAIRANNLILFFIFFFPPLNEFF